MTASADVETDFPGALVVNQSICGQEDYFHQSR